MSPSARELLLHILDETTYLLSACDQLSQADFLSDPTLKRAFARSLEIIGEAVKSLPADLTDAQPGPPPVLRTGQQGSSHDLQTVHQ